MKITIIFPARGNEIGKTMAPVMPLAPTIKIKSDISEPFAIENDQVPRIALRVPS